MNTRQDKVYTAADPRLPAELREHAQRFVEPVQWIEDRGHGNYAFLADDGEMIDLVWFNKSPKAREPSAADAIVMLVVIAILVIVVVAWDVNWQAWLGLIAILVAPVMIVWVVLGWIFD